MEMMMVAITSMWDRMGYVMVNSRVVEVLSGITIMIVTVLGVWMQIVHLWGHLLEAVVSLTASEVDVMFTWTVLDRIRGQVP